ncbi:GPI-anchored adhesin-like protein PGA55 [Asbolus verrucosus]|uniref:GPI-anchored adhesin-like protein PGA55 n=1 Tax=Asbolus verrucosus TaxID=1661398 RepID=A0A482VG90_ASBVE|nr:GPI-anchored adhesin-like protein PGA55 [Asbolus verrucosus]
MILRFFLQVERFEHSTLLLSLSKWNPLLFYQPPAHHGEKSTQLSPILNLDTTNIDLSDMETSVLHCVNPYDVNPISGIPVKSITQEESMSGARSVKLEMEEFSDLAPYLPDSTPKAMSNSIDELNTPIFESPTATDPFKFEYDTIRMGNSVLSNKQLNDFSVYSNNMSVQLQESNNSEVVNIVQGSEANLLFATSESDEGNIYIINNGNETPIHVQSEDQISASLFKVEDNNSVVSVNSNENQYSNVSSPSNEYSVNTNINSIEAQYSNISSPNDEYCRKNLGIETPEDSNSSCATSESSTKKIPKLKITMGFVSQPIVLNTPDVIDSVVDLETNFNILDYVNEKDVTTVNIEDIHFEPPTTGELKTSKLRKRKFKRCDDDDDEDYVPPSKKQASKRASVDYSDSDSEDEIPARSAKRGRPRRTSSISSDHSDASKYRELRDKNNEASRKSRLKRKMKEQTLQREADELYEKNVKLKAQVDEYEKMVNNFRNNLFKIMLKK